MTLWNDGNIDDYTMKLIHHVMRMKEILIHSGFSEKDIVINLTRKTYDTLNYTNYHRYSVTHPGAGLTHVAGIRIQLSSDVDSVGIGFNIN